MKLNAAEINSPLWQKLKQEFETKRAALRAENDQYLSPEKTTELRAKIHLLNDLLAMEVPVTTIPAQPVDDA